jgi:O-antigen/teichoic acid export membrane protein
MSPSADEPAERVAVPATTTAGPSGLRSADDPPGEKPSLGAQAVWLLAAKAVGFAFAIAQPLVLVRALSQLEFGLYKQVFLVVGTAATVLPFGFGMSAFYFLPRERERQGAIVTNIIAFHVGIGALVAAVLVAFPGLLARVFNSPELTDYAPLIAVVVLLWITGTFLEIAPVAMQDVRASTGIIIVNQFSKTALLMAAAVWFSTVRALIAAAIVHGIVQVALMCLYLHSRFPRFWRAFSARLLWRQAAYALPLGASALLWRLQEDVHQAFVSNAFGAASFAIYSVGLFKLPLIGIMREAVGSVVLPRINELETRNQSPQILQLVVVAARKLALVYLPAYALLMVTGPELITVLFTRQYIDSWPIFAVSMTYLPFGILVLDPVTRAHSERYFFLWLRLAILCTLVFVLWRYTAVLGMVGVMVVVTVANIFGWAMTAARMGRLLGATRHDLARFADVGRVAMAAGLAALVAAGVRQWVGTSSPWRVLLACGPTFALVYLAAIVQSGVLGRDEVMRLARDVVRSVWRGKARRRVSPAGSSAAPDPLR